MTESEAFYIIGNISVPTDDENYSICQYQEAKAVALEALEKIQQYKALGTVEELRIAKEKQIPKKPSKDKYVPTLDFCPICGTEVTDCQYCPQCGQKIELGE